MHSNGIVAFGVVATFGTLAHTAPVPLPSIELSGGNYASRPRSSGAPRKNRRDLNWAGEKKLNPPETARTYSSVYGNQGPGGGHGRSMLDSAQAWSASRNSVGEWMQIDLGGRTTIEGVVTQSRSASSWGSQRVTAYQVSTSLDGAAWTQQTTGGGSTLFTGNVADDNANVEGVFDAEVEARFVKITVMAWAGGHISMRAAALISLPSFLIPSSPSPAPPPSYQRWEQGCVNGNNMAYHAGQTVAECAALCDADSSCVAFEYGVDYGGGGGYKPQDCSLQSSANLAGCDGGYWDTDLYVAKDCTKFKFLDIDGDGTMDLEEARSQGMPDALFHTIDAAGDGAITMEEFSSFINSRGNGGYDGQDSNNQRLDSKSWKYKGKKAKNCKWVASAPTAAKRKQRCLLESKSGKRAVDKCKAACAPQ